MAVGTKESDFGSSLQCIYSLRSPAAVTGVFRSSDARFEAATLPYSKENRTAVAAALVSKQKRAPFRRTEGEE